MQKQTGSLASLRSVAPRSGHRHICRFRYFAAGRIAASPTGCTLYRMLQMPDVQQQFEAGGR